MRSVISLLLLASLVLGAHVPAPGGGGGGPAPPRPTEPLPAPPKPTTKPPRNLPEVTILQFDSKSRLTGVRGHTFSINVADAYAQFPPRYGPKTRTADVPKTKKELIYTTKINRQHLFAPRNRVMHVSQYRSMQCPVDLKWYETTITITSGIYNYVDTPGHINIWVNFGHEELFAFAATELFAQDEIQTLEMPLLVCASQIIQKINKPKAPADRLITSKMIATNAEPSPKPILIYNAERWINYQTTHNGVNLYGNGFGNAADDVAVAAATPVDPPTPVNILVLVAPENPNVGAAYTAGEINKIFKMAYVGFRMAKHEARRIAKSKNAKIMIHSGNWGCGAFGGSVQLMSVIQMFAARAAGVNLHLHTVTDQAMHTAAKTLFDQVWPKGVMGGSIKAEAMINALIAKKFKWGVPNGT